MAAMLVGGFLFFEINLNPHKLTCGDKSSRRKSGILGKCSLREEIDCNIWRVKRFIV